MEVNNIEILKCVYYYLHNIVFTLAEADTQVQATTGRGTDEDSNPSAVVPALTKLLSEFTDIFKSGLSSFFRTAKEGEDGEEESDEEESNQKDDSENQRKGGEQIEGNIIIQCVDRVRY